MSQTILVTIKNRTYLARRRVGRERHYNAIAEIVSPAYAVGDLSDVTLAAFDAIEHRAVAPKKIEIKTPAKAAKKGAA